MPNVSGMRRPVSTFAASYLALLAGCGGAPSVSPRPSISSGAAASLPEHTIVTNALPAVATGHKTGSCSARQATNVRMLQPGRGDRVVLAKNERTTLAFVANEDDAAIHTIDLDKHDEIAVTPLPGSPSALVGLSDGRIAVALRDRNEVVVLEPSADGSGALEIRCRTATASEPVGLAAYTVGPDERIVVTSGYGHTLGVLDAGSLEVERTVSLARDPRAVVISGGFAFVSHVVSADLSVVDLATGNVDKINTLSNRKIRSIREKDGDVIQGGQGFSLAMNENGRLFVPMVTVDPGEPKATSSYGGTENPIKPFVGVVDLVAKKELKVPIPGSTDHSLECLLPRAAAAAGDRLFVTCIGSDALLELDGRAQNAAQFIRRRIQLPRGPVGLALHERYAVVMSQFDRAVSIVPVDGASSEPIIVTLSRPAGEVDEVFERGRRMFHDGFDPRLSLDGRACANCHPDGRDDSFTWSTPDGPRQTISLAGRVANEAPFGWFGDHGSLRNHLSQTVSRLGGQGFDTKDVPDLIALTTYISRMKAPVAAPNEASKELIAQGRVLFHDAAQGCGDCHAEGGTDRARHDVGTGNAIEARLSFDTPSLLSIAGSAPYFHDGRFKSLGEMLEKADDKMGHAKHLSADTRAAMVAYMESLEPVPAADVAPRQFVRSAENVTVPSLATNPVEKLALRSRPPRATLESIDFDIDSLPTIEEEPGIKYDEKIAEQQGGVVKPDLLVWKSDCAAVSYHAASHLQLDWRSTGMSGMFERCQYAPDADGVRHWREVLVQTIDPLPNGRLHFEEHRGFIQVATREVRITTSVVADAEPISNGMFYAFRSSCTKCEAGARERLYVIAPALSFWGDEFFHVRTLKLEKGTSDSYSSVFNGPNLARWKQVTKVDVPTGGVVGAPRNVVFRLETSRTATEEKPRVAVGRRTCPEDEFRCN